MPYTDDFSFLRIVFFLIDVGAVPILGLTLSACRPSILNGFRDFTRFGTYLERYRDTVKFHSNNIFRKLQVQNRQQAVNRGRENNLL